MSEQEIAGNRIVTEGNTDCLKGSCRRSFRDRDRKFAMTVVNRNKTNSAGDNFQTLCDGEESESETDLESVLDEQHMW